MDESSRLTNLRNRTLFAFSQSVQHNPQSSDTILNQQVGAIETAARTSPAVPSDPNCLSAIQTSFLTCLEAILTYAATTNLGPTKSSRFYYLFLASVTQGYNWVQSSNRLSGTLDNWNWNIQTLITDPKQLLVWMNRILITITTQLIPTFDSTSILYTERSLLSLTLITQASFQATVYSVGNRDAWFSTWSTWWNQRANDGSVAAAIPPTAAQLPNGTTSLNVASTVNPSTFPSPYQWTPLQIGASIQKYATYNWASVNSTALSTNDMSTIQGAATPFYTGRNTPARQAEISTIVGYTATLTDDQKVNAEFWAGGPYTVSPPGMFVWIWKTLITAQSPSLDTLFFSGLDLTIHLFETGRVVWGLKQQYMEARPIQEIRRLYNGQTLTKYDGTPVQGESWMPYQVPSFVTPPFADFTSGHSGFSQSFATVMTAWFGAAIPTTAPIYMDDLQLLSPIFHSPQSNPLGQITILAGDSEVQPLVVPTTSITFRWTTWQEMALSAGLSRQYGGIHAMSAHQGSVAAVNALHPILKSYWNLSPA